MSDATYSSRDQIPTAPSELEYPHVDIRFDGEFLNMIDKLARSLLSTIDVSGDDKRRQIAIATAVSTLSDYAGQPLYLRQQGQYLEIQGLWRR